MKFLHKTFEHLLPTLQQTYCNFINSYCYSEK